MTLKTNVDGVLNDKTYDIAYMVFINHDEKTRSVIPIGKPITMTILLTSGVIEESIEETKNSFLSEELLRQLPENIAIIVKGILEKSEKIIN